MERNELEETNALRPSDEIALAALWKIFFAVSSDLLLVKAVMEVTVEILGGCLCYIC